MTNANAATVYDNVVNSRYQDFIEMFLLKQAGFAWYMVPDLNKNIPNVFKFDGVPCFVGQEEGINKTMGLSRQPINGGEDNDPFLALLFKTFLFSIEDKIETKINSIIVARAFMQLPWNAPEQNKFHVDLEKPHKVLLYYVNDSDGDTLISDKIYTGEEPTNGVDANVVERISPKKGRAVLFDGATYHAASVPKNNVRCVLNFNFI